MLFGTPQSGGNVISGLNVTDIRPGDLYTLLDGTEVIVTGSKSVAFSRGYSQAGPGNVSFAIVGCPNNSEFVVQGSNGPSDTLARFEASFTDLAGGDVVCVGGSATYTDVGAWQFYRVRVKVFQAGDVPVVTARAM